MNLPREQRGIGFVGLLVLLAVAAFIGVTGLKLFPIYLESFKIDAALKQVIEDPNIAERGRDEIFAGLIKRFDIDDVKSIKWDKIREHIKIQKDNNKVVITATYQARTPL